jgi:pimeloyl-ACP methyl ester carboxylesterase
MASGTQIRYRCWNPDDASLPALLFVHGFRAHSRWWDFIAPSFTDRYRVLALDMSGMGDSGFRPHYTVELFSQNILQVIEDARLAPATLVGHSFGGARVMRFCADYPDLVSRAVVLDSMVHFSAETLRASGSAGRPTPYPDRASILARYRLSPEQLAEPYLREYVARHSIREVPGGWRWKFDPSLPLGTSETNGTAILDRIRVPFHYVCGELSAIVTPELRGIIGTALPPGYGSGPIVIRGAHHHLMLDQPRLLIETLRAILC